MFLILVVICQALGNPTNGTINCTLGDDGVLSYEDTCSYTCNTGYELVGSDQRMCLFDGTWNGDDEVLCRQRGGSCTVARVDINHSVTVGNSGSTSSVTIPVIVSVVLSVVVLIIAFVAYRIHKLKRKRSVQ